MKWFCNLSSESIRKTRLIFIFLFGILMFIGIGLFGFIFWLYLELYRKNKCSYKKAIAYMILISILLVSLIEVDKEFNKVRDLEYAGKYYCGAVLKIMLHADGSVTDNLKTCSNSGKWTSKNDKVTISMCDGTILFKKMSAEKVKYFKGKSILGFHMIKASNNEIYNNCYRHEIGINVYDFIRAIN